MNVRQWLDELNRQGITLQAEGDRLRIRGPEAAITFELQNTILEHKPAILAQLQIPARPATNGMTDVPRVIPVPEERYQPFPLTDIQQAYWVGRGDALTLGGVSTHGYYELQYQTLDVARLNDTLQKLMQRHEMLRTIISTDGQQQILAQAPPYQILVCDLSNLDLAAQEAQLQAIRAEMSHQVLPTDQAPMVDIRVTRLGEHALRLHISMDILMFDVGSVQLLFSEWERLYHNPDAQLPALELSFRDYSLAEAQAKTGTAYETARQYWLERLDTLPPAPELPLAKAPEQLTATRFVRRTVLLEAQQWQSLKAQAKAAGVSPTVLVLGAFATILQRWSKHPRFTLNLTLFNRLPLHPQVNAIIGDFTSINLLAIDLTDVGSFLQQVKAIQKQLWYDIEYRLFSGVDVLRELGRRQGNPLGTLMPVVFTSTLGVGRETGLNTETTNRLINFLGGEILYSVSQTPQVWLDHQVFEEKGALSLNWDVVEELFPAGLLDDMFATYHELLQRLAGDETAWRSPQHTLVPAPQQALLQRYNATAVPLSDEMLHTLFLKQVDCTPKAIAVVSGQRSLTYGELCQRATQVGHWLRARGAKPNTLVAVVMEKGWEQVVAVLGIHLAGAAYLPIDPNLPAERQQYLLEQGEVTLVLTQQALTETVAIPAKIAQLAVDTLPAEETVPAIDIIQRPSDLAYVIYTSGSTGLPKGVIIDHRGAVNTVLDINRRFAITAADCVLALSPLNFDLSVYDIFGLLAVGGTIVLPDPGLRTDPAHWRELLTEHSVTLWNTVPALMQMLVDEVEHNITQVTEEKNDLAPLRLVMMSGDWIPLALPNRIQALWPQTQVHSLGGATEASIWSITYPIAKVDATWASIPYGQPMANQTFYVLDPALDPCPLWVPGDLYIGGIGLALGYWKDPERTDASFIVHPRSGERLYKTGDLGRYVPTAFKDGCPQDLYIEFLGREDFQVKIRGHRIELGEIEHALLQHPDINEAVVTAMGDPKGHHQLATYIVPNGEHHGDLFTVQRASEEYLMQRWQALIVAGECPPVVGNTFLTHTSTNKLTEGANILYLKALWHAFAHFGLYQSAGERYRLDELMSRSGIIPRYRKWLKRALHVLIEEQWLFKEPTGADDYYISRHALPQPTEHAVSEIEGMALLGDSIELVTQIVENLADILTEQFHSAELYANAAVPTLYQDSFAEANAIAAALTAAVSQVHADQAQTEPLRILEVGGGYGSTTVHLLPTLSPAQTSYHFTAVSAFFLQRAQKLFTGYPFLEYGLLDLERSPQIQGYTAHSFDLIVASSVLHVPRRVDDMVAHLQSLLAPGGLLLIIEETKFHRFFDLSMGLQSGFERFTDHDLRPLHPLLSCAQWQTALQKAGFGRFATFGQSATATQLLGITILVAQGPTTTEHFDLKRVRAHLEAKLPEYMLPASIQLLERLPLTGNGKVDRRALPAPDWRANRTESFVAPRTPTERQLAEIWRTLLNLPQVGIHDNFFEVGGDSLIVTQARAQFRERFGLELSLRTLFACTTIAELAEQIDAQQAARAMIAQNEGVAAQGVSTQDISEQDVSAQEEGEI